MDGPHETATVRPINDKYSGRADNETSHSEAHHAAVTHQETVRNHLGVWKHPRTRWGFRSAGHSDRSEQQASLPKQEESTPENFLFTGRDTLMSFLPILRADV